MQEFEDFMERFDWEQEAERIERRVKRSQAFCEPSFMADYFRYKANPEISANYDFKWDVEIPEN